MKRSRHTPNNTYTTYTQTHTQPKTLLKHSTSLRAAQDRLGRILTGTFGSIDEAAS